jgi:thiosulfate dehydrogenase
MVRKFRRRPTGRQLRALVAASIVMLYALVIVLGLQVKSLTTFSGASPKGKMAWTAPHERDIPDGELGASIRRGELIFVDTPQFAPQFTHSRISCGSCHAEGGIQPYSSPMVGIPPLFPMFNKRAGHVITLKGRIQECFVRSENGTPLPYDGAEMSALVDYISWLSRPVPGRRPFIGRGLNELSELKPDPENGRRIYAAQCAGCHGHNGDGRAPLAPPVWGAGSFNDGAGMNGVPKMAAFVQHNMPQNRMGILSAQEAYDVSEFIHTQPRPVFNQAYKHF